MRPVPVTAWTATCAAGSGRAALLGALRAGRSGLTPNNFGRDPVETWIGRVPGIEEVRIPAALADFDCRNNRLAWLGLQRDGFAAAVDAARANYGASKLALVLGTSTSTIGATEEGYTRLTPAGEFPAELSAPGLHSPHSTGDFLRRALGIGGVAVTVATACSSSAKAFAQGARLIELGIADAVVVGGVDSLCGSVLFGFHSLELVAADRCRPFDAARRGLNLGEAAGFALLEREGAGIRLAGYGESSDAHHMSAPHPQGRGARQALADAFARAGREPDDIDYINLHGTATQMNDEIEARVIASLFPPRTHASSTKGWTGHALGAAGIIEAVVTMLAIEHGFLPGTLNSERLDDTCGPQIRLESSAGPVRVAISNSFGFGGSNCVLLFEGAA